jgi:glycosyltransferase involved in cell wall biosynthesis
MGTFSDTSYNSGMPKPDLTCVFFPDLTPWERESVRPILHKFSQNYLIEEIQWGESSSFVLPRREGAGAYWILSSDWKAALTKLGLGRTSPHVSASVFGSSPEKGTLFTLLWRKLFSSYPKSLRLLTHSPLNYRFFSEIVGMPASQVGYLPLPFTKPSLSQKSIGVPEGRPVIGTLAAFKSESNLNFFLNIAHYVVRKHPNAYFRILGTGQLYGHLTEMIRELSLEDHVSVTETLSIESLEGLDIFLYAPLRNDHFAPLLYAANRGIPVLCSEIPGIADLVQDGKTGFVIPSNETKPMGELILRLLDHPSLRASMASELQSRLLARFSEDQLESEYRSFFFGDRTSSVSTISQAA